jgi:hypothetical protein
VRHASCGGRAGGRRQQALPAHPQLLAQPQQHLGQHSPGLPGRRLVAAALLANEGGLELAAAPPPALLLLPPVPPAMLLPPAAAPVISIVAIGHRYCRGLPPLRHAARAR